MFQDIASYDFKKEVRESYWKKIQKYHTQMKQIFKSLD